MFMAINDPELNAMFDWDSPDDTLLTDGLKASTQSINKFFDDLEVQCALGEHSSPPSVATTHRVKLGGERDWDIWYSAEAADCPTTGPGCYKRVGAGLIKVK
jgi:hypothetical protein